MNLSTAPYLEQQKAWPHSGRHILAQFDDETIVVYQAYSPAIGNYAVQHGVFGGDFSYHRMSWIKPNFLWMMYRSNWGRSQGQEVVLAIRIKRRFFDSLLEQAVPSSFDATMYGSHDGWKSAVGRSEVRLQWDPDHSPNGTKEERRAIQLGLRGGTLSAYGKQEIIEIIDMSAFVAAQRDNATRERYAQLLMPVERSYIPTSPLGLDPIGLSSL